MSIKLYKIVGDWNNGAETWESNAVYDKATAEREAEVKAARYPHMDFSLVLVGEVATATDTPEVTEVTRQCEKHL